MVGTGGSAGDAPVIVAEGLSRSFGGVPAVDELSFEVRAGEVVALIGPNGAGKTTTIRILNGVVTPDRGRSSVLGMDPVRDGDELRRHTGVLTETADLDPRLTAMENLVLTARIRGERRETAEPAAGELLEQFAMSDRADELVTRLSTGQRKRLALARALLHRPDVLFLDEPTSGLDPEAARGVVDLIALLARDEGRTFVLCTHLLQEAERLCNRVLVLDHGQRRAFGRPQDIAAQLWDQMEVELDLGAPADQQVLETMLLVSGVGAARPIPQGALVEVADRSAVPALTAALVGMGIPLYGVTQRPPTLEDVYFALREREA